jgi:hypothetical protein
MAVSDPQPITNAMHANDARERIFASRLRLIRPSTQRVTFPFLIDYSQRSPSTGHDVIAGLKEN